MAGAKGYNNYRGRGSGWKILLAVILVLVTVAAVGAIALRENITYDETGRLHLSLPWQDGEGGSQDGQNENPNENGTTPEPVENPDLDPSQSADPGPSVPEEPEDPEPPQKEALYAYTIPVNAPDLQAAMSEPLAASAPPYNAAAVTLKDNTGSVYYPFEGAIRYALVNQYTQENLSQLTGESSSLHSIARISCLQDPRAANSSIKGLALLNNSGYVYKDGTRSSWLDPGRPGAQEYLCKILKEAAELGFDELLLTEVSYPTTGNLARITYTEEEKAVNLKSFLDAVRNALEPYEVKLSIELPEAVVSGGADPVSGQRLAELAPLVDRIYVQTTPEQMEALSAAVTAANQDTELIAELTDYTPDTTGSCLVFWN